MTEVQTPNGMDAGNREGTVPERLILMAAGFGSRMRPLTDSVPKPLIRVNGKRMIDRTIEAALDAGIRDIVVVRGYKADAFDELLDDYPMVRFVDNELYDKGNNAISVYKVRDLLANAYVAEADLVLRNPALLAGPQVHSNYLAVPCESTDDWAFETVRDDEGDRIVAVHPCGGNGLAHMYGISYWTPEDAEKLAVELEHVLSDPANANLYFEEIPLDMFRENHRVYIRPCSFDDITELDTVEDLVAEDPSWAERLES